MADCKVYVWVGTGNGQIFLFNKKDSKLLKNWEAHPSPITSICMAIDSTVWTGSDRGEIAFWQQVDNGKISLLGRQEVHNRTVQSIKLVTTHHIWSISASRSIVVWDVKVSPLYSIIPSFPSFHHSIIPSFSSFNHSIISIIPSFHHFHHFMFVQSENRNHFSHNQKDEGSTHRAVRDSRSRIEGDCSCK